MPNSNPVVIPFPKRIAPLDCPGSAGCHFQAAAELRVAMLHKLFGILARAEADTSTARDLHELCQGARELLNDVVVLYRSSLEQAQGRAQAMNKPSTCYLPTHDGHRGAIIKWPVDCRQAFDQGV